jgi:hypothetical protein
MSKLLAAILKQVGPRAFRWGGNELLKNFNTNFLDSLTEPSVEQQGNIMTGADALGSEAPASGMDSGLDIAFGGSEPGLDAGATAVADTAATAGTQEAGGLGLSGLGDVGLSELAPYIPIAGTAFAIWNAIQKGSGRNEPVEKRMETSRIEKLASDMLSGNKIDWNDENATHRNYGEMAVPGRYLPEGVGGEGSQTVDPRGPNMKDLYDRLIEMSSSRYQQGGLGNSGFSGNDVNDFFKKKGLDKQLADALGYTQLPDWSQYDKGSGFASPDYLKGISKPQSTIQDAFDALPPEEKDKYLGLAKGKGMYTGGTIDPLDLFRDDQTISDLNKNYGMTLKDVLAQWQDTQARL